LSDLLGSTSRVQRTVAKVAIGEPPATLRKPEFKKRRWCFTAWAIEGQIIRKNKRRRSDA